MECALGSVEAEQAGGAESVDGAPARLLLRPEWLTLGSHGVEATVSAVAYAGHDALVSLDLGGGSSVRAHSRRPICRRAANRVTVGVRHRAGLPGRPVTALRLTARRISPLMGGTLTAKPYREAGSGGPGLAARGAAGGQMRASSRSLAATSALLGSTWWVPSG